MSISRRGFFTRLVGAIVVAKAAPALTANEPAVTSAPLFINDGAHTVGYMAFGPDSFTLGELTPPTSDLTVTGLGFEPKSVIFYNTKTGIVESIRR